MATTIVFRNLKTHPRAIPQNGYQDMLVANPVTTALTRTTDDVTPNERYFLGAGIPIHFWSERVLSEVTVSGLVTFAIRANTAAPGFTGRLRAKLYKITTGGSDVESFIGQADASSDIVNQVSTTYTFSFTPAVPVTLAPNERFICRVSVMPVAGSFGTGTVFITFGGGITASTCSITFTETIVFRLNGVTLVLRATSTNGIGNFFDLSETRTAGAVQTGVVNTTAGGTEIQWTRTAGGTLLEWISLRFKSPGWTVDTVAAFGSLVMYALESNDAANCSTRYKVFRRKPDGTETLVVTWTTNLSGELITTYTAITVGLAHGVLAQSTNFAEDDRLVFRAYIIPANGLTMGGSRTCTIGYDKVTPNTTNDCRIPLLDAPEFKAAGDPGGISSVPGGQTMGGVGN